MSKKDIIRAWKDGEYRQSLSEAERAMLPEHPAGLIDLTDAELATVAGGKRQLKTFNNARSCRALCPIK